MEGRKRTVSYINNVDREYATSMYLIELKNRRTFDLILVQAHFFVFVAHATLGEDAILTLSLIHI